MSAGISGTISSAMRAPVPAAVWIGMTAVLAIIGIAFAATAAPGMVAYLQSKDFANYWLASRLVLHDQVGDLFSGQPTYYAALQAAFGADINWHNWSYPPHYLLFMAPLGLTGYLPAMVLFLAVTLAIFLHAASLATRGLTPVTLLLLLSAIGCNILFTQNGFLTSALLIYGISLRQTRPILAGIAIGMLTIKPQLGFLLPLLLIVERRWSVMLAAAVTAALMVMLSVALWGTDSWIGYVSRNLPYQKSVMLELEGLFILMVPSVYGSLRVLATDAQTSLSVHSVTAGLLFCGFLYSLWKARSDAARAAATVFATFMVTPYSLVYDMGALSVIAIVALTAAVKKGVLARPGGLTKVLPLLLVCLLPFLTIPLGVMQLPIAPLVIALGWLSAMTVVYGRQAPLPATVAA